jgi:RNA polymerase sporulation-specific sigma factor
MGMKYEKLSHEKLAVYAREGDEAALDLLYREYRETIRGKATPFFLTGGEREDLIQEGMIGLFHAIMAYNPAKEASFRTFAERLIAHQMIAAVRSAERLKHRPLNTSLSLDAAAFGEKGGSADEYGAVNLGDTLQDDSASPEELLLANDIIDVLEKESAKMFSKLELAVWEEYKKGLSYTEIAKFLGKPTKTIDNALQRMKRKVALIFSNNFR